MSNPVKTQWIEIAPGLGGYLALPPAGKGPGLVLFQEIFGVNEHIRGVVEQYALDGFVVLAPDLFWRNGPKIELGYEGADRARAMELMHALTPETVASDITASVKALRERPETAGAKLGAVGYCLGGRLAYNAAAMGGIDAALAYYGGGIQNQLDRAAFIKCPMQFHYAGHDDNIPPAAVDSVLQAFDGKPVQLYVYPGAHHGFNCWARGTYDAPSAALAHGRSLEFLAEALF